MVAAVDGTTLRKLQQDLGDEPEVMRELLDTFMTEAPRLLEAMREGLRTRQASEINRAAHSLRSTAAMFGAGTLSLLCRELELETAAQLPADAAKRVERVLAEWEQVRRELQALRP